MVFGRLALAVAAAMAGVFPAVVAAQMIEAGPDATPLLYDRLRNFAAVVVVTAPEGFARKTLPVKGTNSVSMALKIEEVLKGELAAGDLKVDVHENLPKLLAARDKDKEHRYLLALQLNKGRGYLGGGMLYVDLDRIMPTNAGLEKVAKAFIAARETSAAALVKLSAELLADELVTSSAVAEKHINQLLTRLAKESGGEEWKAVGEASLRAVWERAISQIEVGKAMDSAPALVLALAERKDNPDGLKLPEAKAGEQSRK